MLAKLLPDFMAAIVNEMSPRRRWQLLALVGLLLVNAVVEFANFGLFFLLVQLLSVDLGGGSDVETATGIKAMLLSLSPLALGILFVSILAFAGAIRLLSYWASAQFAYRLAYDFGVQAYSRFLHQNLAWHKSRNSSDIIAVMTKAQVLSHSLVLPFLKGLTGAITASGAVIFLLSISLVPTIGLALIYVGSYFLIAMIVRPALRRNSMKVKEAHQSRIRSGQEAAASIRDVILGGMQTHFVQRFKYFDARYRDGSASSLVLTGTPRFILEAIGVASLIGLTLYFFNRDGGLADVLPILAALGLGAQRLLPLAQDIYSSWAVISANRAIADEVLESARRPQTLSAAKSVEPLPFENELTLENCTFGYSADRDPVLDNVDLTIKRGTTVGFVGQTGGGKSTLIDILMGLMRPDSGMMRVDTHDIVDNLDVHRWQRNLSHVPQEIVLVDATIAENIAFGIENDRIDMDRVRECVKQAELQDFIERLPHGIDTQVGERGTQLSGGQRQRVGLARALYTRAPVMVLDEATSALDTETEARVMNRISSVSDEMTVLIVAHRLSTLGNCDVIYEVGGGKLIRHEPSRYLARSETAA